MSRKKYFINFHNIKSTVPCLKLKFSRRHTYNIRKSHQDNYSFAIYTPKRKPEDDTVCAQGSE